MSSKDGDRGIWGMERRELLGLGDLMMVLGAGQEKTRLECGESEQGHTNELI